MAALYLCALLALACTCQAANFLGGATSITAFANDIVSGYNSGNSTDVPAYAVIGSGKGISGLINKTFKIGSTDVTLNNNQNNAADKALGAKYTLPLTLTSYNLMTKKASGIKLTAATVASIYHNKGITKWSSIRPGLSGTIVPVARKDDSGTTKLISQWLASRVSYWITPDTASWSKNTNGFFKKSIVYHTGTRFLGSYLASDSNSIGYIQTGAGLSRKLYETAIYNKAKIYIKPSAADLYQSVPASLPSSHGSWSGISLLDKKGNTTYPIVSFVYTVVGINAGSKAKDFLTYSQSTAVQSLVSGSSETISAASSVEKTASAKYANTLKKLPAAIIRKNLRAIRRIR